MYLSLRERSGQRSSVGPTCFASRELSARLETCLTRMSPGEPMWPRAAFEGSCLAHVDAGGLISCGPDLPDMFRRCGVYVGRILGGIKPADLPIERPARFELVVNLKIAKGLGLTIPEAILLRDDEIID
jgi:hypothetical protein